jgi:DNA-directed RNA polymerase subunit delta
MAIKPDKAKKAAEKTNSAPGKHPADKNNSKPKKVEEANEDDELFEEEVDKKPAAKSIKGAVAGAVAKKSTDEEEDDEVDDGPDEWEKPEEEEEWDPDFEEFDVPQSKGRKSSSGKKGEIEEDDFKIDDEFKDLFNDKDFDDDEEEDY